MNFKKIIFILLIIFSVIIFIFISKNMTKKTKNGNNMSSQEVVENVLNINSYKAKVTVEVQSNKNKNKYILKQEYNTENGYIQEVLEPANIAGIKITRKDNNLLIENSKLDLKTIFENYEGLENKCLDLYNFINKYKSEQNSIFEENEQEIKLKIKSNNNKYQENEILYINREKIIPTKLLVQDNNNNITIIIEYNEIELN